MINKINDQKNLIQENLKIMNNKPSKEQYEKLLELRHSVIQKIGFLIQIIRNLKKKIKFYKNEAN